MKTKAEYHAEKFRKRHGIGKNNVMELYGHPIKVYTKWKQEVTFLEHDIELLKFLASPDDDDRELTDFVWRRNTGRGISDACCYTGMMREPVICLNKDAFSHSKDVTEAIFYHELGHCLLHSRNNALRQIFPQFIDDAVTKNLLFTEVFIALVQYCESKHIALQDTSISSFEESDDAENNPVGYNINAARLQIKILDLLKDSTPNLEEWKSVDFRNEVFSIIEDYLRDNQMKPLFYNTVEFIDPFAEIEAHLFVSANLSVHHVFRILNISIATFRKAGYKYGKHFHFTYVSDMYDVFRKVYYDPRMQELLPYYKLMDPEEWKAKFAKR